MHKINLALVEGLVVDKLRERRHGGVMVELGNLANQQAKRCIAVFTFIVFLASQLASEHAFQFLVITTGKRNIVGQLVDGHGIAVFVDVAVYLGTVILEIIGNVEHIAFFT